MNSKPKFSYQTLSPDDFAAVIVLGNQVHGEGYLTDENIRRWAKQGWHNGINASFVVYDNSVKPKRLVGFRISFAANHWHLDKWCTPELWRSPTEQVAYFKCNTVAADYRGQGVGGKLLALSRQALKQQGAKAGVSHLWRQSPGNSAVKYFTKCGGQLIKDHPRKWQQDCDNGYACILCGFDCYCEAAEMIIYFD